MIKATLQTANFEFVAYGQTVAHAVNALRRGLVKHGEQYDLSADWFSQYEGDIYTMYFALNKAYRDNEQLKG